MEDKLRAALEAGNGEQLLKLCREVGENIELTFRGYEAYLAHHIAAASIGKLGLDCLMELVKRFGEECLMTRDKVNNTAVHVAAKNQNKQWLQSLLKSHCHSNHDSLLKRLSKSSKGNKWLEVNGQYNRSCVHFAALNTGSDTTIRWLVKHSEPKCLLVTDEHSNTAVHLAALTQGPDTMAFIQRLLKDESTFFTMPGHWRRTVMHFSAMSDRGPETFLWLMSKCRSDHVILKDADGNTPIHLAALYQNAECLQALRDKFGIEIFRMSGAFGDTVVHSVAKNTRNISALSWCIRSLGPTYLKDKNRDGATPVHLVARYQGVEGIGLIKDSVGVSVFELMDAEGRTVADYAVMNEQRDRVLGWMREKRLPHALTGKPMPLSPSKSWRIEDKGTTPGALQDRLGPVSPPPRPPRKGVHRPLPVTPSVREEKPETTPRLKLPRPLPAPPLENLEATPVPPSDKEKNLEATPVPPCDKEKNLEATPVPQSHQDKQANVEEGGRTIKFADHETLSPLPLPLPQLQNAIGVADRMPNEAAENDVCYMVLFEDTNVQTTSNNDFENPH